MKKIMTIMLALVMNAVIHLNKYRARLIVKQT